MPTTLRVALSDASMDRLHDLARQQERDLELSASQHLANALISIPSEGRYAVLSQKELQQLEDLLGGGSILNGDDLLKKVQRLAGITYGHIRLQFSPGQLEDLKRKADRQGKTVEQLVEQMAPRIHEQFFGLIDQRA
jgi:hypothetical protein